MPHDDLAQKAAACAERSPEWLSAACQLAPDTLAPLLAFYLPLAEHIARMQEAKRGAVTIGIQGPQAAGKTTLTHLLERVLTDVAELRVATLSIDDLYLSRAERSALAARVHPLFMTRGVPGTHDVQLGVRVLEALTRPGRTAIPRFDKAQDDRTQESTWPRIEGPCDVVLFEGLWVGLPALDEATLREPINELEAREDPRGVWRGYANQQLRDRYPELFAPCETLIHFQVPDFACVKRWRSGAEHALRARLERAAADTSRVMDDAALARFFDHYERFSLHAMRAMPARAAVVLSVDREHRVVDSTLSRL
jgi:D-glycerate 3-kinase